MRVGLADKPAGSPAAGVSAEHDGAHIDAPAQPRAPPVLLLHEGDIGQTWFRNSRTQQLDGTGSRSKKVHALAGDDECSARGLGLLKRFVRSAKECKIGLQKIRLYNVSLEQKAAIVFPLNSASSKP